MSWLLSTTVGKAAVFYVDFICALMAKGFEYLDGDDGE